MAQIQQVTGRLPENEAQMPQNVVKWSSTLPDVDVGNFSFCHGQPKCPLDRGLQMPFTIFVNY